MLERSEDSSRCDGQIVRLANLNDLFLNQSIKPGSVNRVFNEFLGFKKFDKILDGSSDFSANFNLLQSQNKSLSGLFAVGSLCEQVSELRVSIFVDSTVGANTEISPDIGSGLEFDSFNGSRCRLESFIRVFGSDTGSNDMGVDRLVIFLHEIDLISSIDILASIKSTNLRDGIEWDTHGNLKLSGRHVDSGDTFSNRVLDLETGVQLQEEEGISVSVVQVFDCTRTNITDVLGQSLGGFLHEFESVRLGNGWRTFLKNLLETTLGGAVTSIQGDGVTMLVSNNLNFQVASILAKLHDEDRRTNNFVADLDVGILQIFLVIDETDTLTTSSF
mmetsp:Transcript_105102/g.206152  ORF Transcript_105102/g.206152 Transcript_105102/m.206152 type:complete len:332 (+) Transcript_105102:138-1133(+)